MQHTQGVQVVHASCYVNQTSAHSVLQHSHQISGSVVAPDGTVRSMTIQAEEKDA